ncbi:MAG: lipoate--protein ligase [Kiritimatiellales bacterium]|jgi:lipoate-protein ligase A
MLIVQSQSTDVYRNLAVEEWLLNHAGERGPILFLCVNAPCVVIGKNQNPWRECRLSLMEKENVPLARRISGGGAVYHDEGNLNVGVIVPRTEYREEKQYDLIFQTLEKFGIRASKLRKNSLAVDGKKFSGQAFSFRGQHVLHHGTLLVNSDLKRLGRYLGSEFAGIETKAVASVPAEVANLSSFAPDLTAEKLSLALIDEFRIMYEEVGQASCLSGQAGSLSYVEDIPEADLLPMIGKLSSKDWKLGHTPRFQVTINGQTLEVEKGRIAGMNGSPLFEEWVKK